jgi:hypothetical protein
MIDLYELKERQQNVVPVKKHNWSVLVFVAVAIAQLFSGPEYRRERFHDFSDDDNGDGLLYELDGDDTGYTNLYHTIIYSRSLPGRNQDILL